MLEAVKTGMNTLSLVPVPTTWDYIEATERHWFPFLEGISKRSKEPVEDLKNQITRREVQVLMAWDGEKAVAIAGVRYLKHGDILIGEIVWCTGRNRKEWQHLVSEIERFLKDMHCNECRPICRLGWSKLLKQRGYRTTHLVMEKIL